MQKTGKELSIFIQKIKNVALFFEFFRKSVYIMHIKQKFKRYGYNN